MQKNTFTTLAIAFSAIVSTFVLASAASAGTINLSWNQNPEPTVIGYKVHLGTQPGTYTQQIDVGPTTSWSFTSAVAGQQYCFVVTAYVSAALESQISNEVCGFSNAPPVLTNPGTQNSQVGQAASLQLVGNDPMGEVLTYGATGLPPGLTLMASTGYISGTPTAVGNYSVTVRALDGVLTASQMFTWNVTTVDAAAPVVTITGPTSAATWSTSATTLTLSGTASDNVGVTQVTWVNSRGGTGTASGTTSWSSSVALQTGSNVLTVTARDAAGNTSSDTLTVAVGSGDTTAPAVAMTSPSNGERFKTASPSVTLGGTASDNVGVTKVVWTNNRGGSGMASGTASWSASVALQTGPNVLTATASDAAGNTNTATITVTRDTAPTLTTVANQVTTAGTAVSLQLSGADADGDALTYGGNGMPPGLAIAVSTGLISGTPTTAGSYPVTVTVSDGMLTATRTFTWTVNATSDTVRPVVTITTPTTATTFSTGATQLSIGGTASDNVGVTQVSWSSDRGDSGTAAGTTNWSATIWVERGVNVLTVTARDAAGNTSTDTITLTRSTSADTTKPVITITDPEKRSLTLSANRLRITGTAGDDVGVTQIGWRNSLGGSGVASGTSSWLGDVKLRKGVNVITFTAYDAAGNAAATSLTVTKP